MKNKFMNSLKDWLVLLASFFVFSAFAQAELPQDFENWVEGGRQDWKIPGMAIGIVKDGEVVFAKGFGEKRLGSGDIVDEHTDFSIASVRKNITAAALGILADREQIKWDDKITDHIPWFKMKDAFVTEEITIRDALTHRSGLGRILGNRLQFMTKSSRDEVLFQMRYMDLEKPFRSDFVYNNVMYSLAGQVIEYTDGRSWDEFLQQELFRPLGMTRTTTNLEEMLKQENIAFPHQEIDGKVVEIPRRNWDNAGPAGGVNASVSDLNKWMLMQLEIPGNYQNKTLISKQQMNEIHKPQVIRGQRNALDAQATYGYGWTITDYKGKRVLTHGGATDGFNTAMYLLPELDLGIIVVGNTFNNFGNAIAYQVMDAFLEDSDKDWHKEYFENHQGYYKYVQQKREEIHQTRHKKTKPSLKVENYTGIYFSEGYGKAEVIKEGKDLKIRFWEDEDLEAVLEHWHFDTFRAVWKNPAMREEFMQFHLDKSGQVEALDFEFVLRPMLLQVGAYPSNYTQTVKFEKTEK